METKEYKLPMLDDFKTIPGEQIEEFSEDGHTITKGLLSPEGNSSLSFNNYENPL